MSAQHEGITLYVDLRADPATPMFPWTLAFFSDPNAQTPRPGGGQIDVKKEGAMIEFKKVTRPMFPIWSFHDLTIHPVGPEKDKVDLKWMVTNDSIVLHNPGKKRTFAYAISVQIPGTKFYFDPQMVNEGGNR